jgi:hypothetical protein
VVLLHHSSEIVFIFWNIVSRRGSFRLRCVDVQKDGLGINQWFSYMVLLLKNLNTAPIGADTSQQQLLTTPQHGGARRVAIRLPVANPSAAPRGFDPAYDRLGSLADFTPC